MTITYQKLLKSGYRETLTDLYTSDPDFIPDYLSFHPDLATLEDCIDHTMELFTEKALNFNFWCIFVDDKMAAYFGEEKLDPPWMTGWFIKPEYRHRRFIKFFWSIIEGTLGNYFLTAVDEKNIKARRFLAKELEVQPSHKCIIYAHNSSNGARSATGATIRGIGIRGNT